MQGLTAFLSGVLFGTGLLIAGMTRPELVVAFLDIFGNWDPTLAFVMGGAILVHMPLRRLAEARGVQCPLPDQTRIDPRLVIGSMLFGMGWGLSGICPGPALVSLGSGEVSMLIFASAMLAGMLVYRKLAR